MDIIIVGAGASGLACAITAARGGKKVLVLEAQPVPARKILISGNGRCNFTNQNVSAAKYNGDKAFITAALDKFSFKDCLDFFESLGLLYRAEEEGRVFPTSGKASSVADCLVNAAERAGVVFNFNTAVSKITKTGNYYKVFIKNGDAFEAPFVVLACGSCAYPQVGGNESGYGLTKALGHSVGALTPALCAINLKEKAVARLAGLKAQANITLTDGSGRFIDAEEGEIIFGAHGISGNNVLSISRGAKAGYKILVDFFPQFAAKDFAAFINKRRADYAQVKIKDFFAGLLADNLANLLMDYLGIKKTALCIELKGDIFDRINTTLKAWPFTVESLRPWKEAALARGGVNTAEVAQGSFESKKARGVFITGELLDIDGRCGGYNLHFAWAGGVCAAKAILKE